MTLGRARLRRWCGVGCLAVALAAGAFAVTAAVVAAANGDLRLVEAARKNDRQTIRTLVKQGVDVEFIAAGVLVAG